ncbi:MAG: hypothetical protein RSF68_00860 [Myroides sp.]
MKDFKDKIVSFLNSYPRNRLIISVNSCDIEEINCIDVGRLLALELKNIEKNKMIFKINQLLDEIINQNKFKNSEFGETIAIKNIGILLEPELKFNFEKFISDYSQNNTLILKWEGQIASNQLFFLNNNDNHKIDLNNISYIVI